MEEAGNALLKTVPVEVDMVVANSWAEMSSNNSSIH
jgi:hypothetical protein